MTVSCFFPIPLFVFHLKEHQHAYKCLKKEEKRAVDRLHFWRSERKATFAIYGRARTRKKQPQKKRGKGIKGKRGVRETSGTLFARVIPTTEMKLDQPRIRFLRLG